MKKTILIVLMLVMAGCSFTKKSSQDAETQTLQKQSRVDEVMNDERYSNLIKAEVAIKKGMWDIFEAALSKLTAKEMNSLTTDGETLGAIALRMDRIDFLEALLKAGMSPFRESYSFTPQQNRTGEIYREALRMNNTRAVELIQSYRNKYLDESAKLCATNISELVEFLDVNFISPTNWVCGEGTNLFTAVMGKINPSQSDVNEIIKKYLDLNRSDSQVNLSFILKLALWYSNESALSKIDVYCSGKTTACRLNSSFDLNDIFPDIDERIQKFLLLKKTFRIQQDFVTSIKRDIFTAVKYSSGESKELDLSILEKYNLKAEYDQIEESLEKPIAMLRIGAPLPPPPVNPNISYDEYGQPYSK